MHIIHVQVYMHENYVHVHVDQFEVTQWAGLGDMYMYMNIALYMYRDWFM